MIADIPTHKYLDCGCINSYYPMGKMLIATKRCDAHFQEDYNNLMKCSMCNTGVVAVESFKVNGFLCSLCEVKTWGAKIDRR